MSDSLWQLEGRKYVIAALFATAWFLMQCNDGRTQEAGVDDLKNIVFRNATDNFRIKYFQPNVFMSSFTYNVAKNVQVFPNRFQVDKSYSTYLDQYQRVPTKDGGLSTDDTASVISRLTKLNGDIEFSERKLSDKDQAMLKSARELLFRDSTNDPTQAYSVYLDFQKRYQDGLNKLKTETNPAALVNIKSELLQIQSQWKLAGRDRIDSALRAIGENDHGKAEKSYKDWIDQINGDPAFITTSIANALVKGVWLRNSLSDTDLSDLDLSLVLDGQKFRVPRLWRISFDTALVPVAFPSLFHPFLEDTNWRTISGYTISDGAVGNDSNELVPRFISHLLLIKNLEFSFSDVLPDGVSKKLADSNRVQIATLVIRSPGSASLNIQDQTISTASPMILGYATAEISKIPNPAIGNTWK